MIQPGPLLDKARMQLHFGKYVTGRADALTDASLHIRTIEAKRKLSGRIIPIDRDGIRAKMVESEFFASRKIDGEFTVVASNGTETITLNPYGTVRTGITFLDEITERLGKAGIDKALIVGELYVVRDDGRPCRVHDIIHACRNPQSQAHLDTLRLAVFDIIEIDDRPVQEPYPKIYSLIERLFKDGERVHPVETRVLRKNADIEAFFDQVVDVDGGEGLIARSEEAGIFKIKPRHNLDVAIVGYTEGQDDRTGLLHDVLVAAMRPEGLFHLVGRVGGGFNDDERRDWLSDLKDTRVRSEYAEVNDGVAYEFVKPEIVIEISCLDLIDQSTRGAPIEKMVLDWKPAESRYDVVRRMPLCYPISPYFVRRRYDKHTVPVDIPIKQIADLLDVPLADKNAAEMVLPKSELIHRAVFTKTLQGNLMVRKLLLWKTNKDAHDPDYPAYVAYVTDFSPNRKAPLERDIRVSNSREQIDELYGDLMGKYVVKGWEQQH